MKPELASVVSAERLLAEIKTTANLQHPQFLPLAGDLYHVADPNGMDDRSRKWLWAFVD